MLFFGAFRLPSTSPLHAVVTQLFSFSHIVLGRKRPSQEFGPPGGDGDLDQGFNKRGRFDEGGRGGVPPATLRVLVRQQDAGGIIGKVRGPPGVPTS